ncbi:MAG: DUF4340 domain-containing protein [Pedosphaera sp.]|nr:DUF4340 domain-containing protein [Pedosphaera sp.]
MNRDQTQKLIVVALAIAALGLYVFIKSSGSFRESGGGLGKPFIDGFDKVVNDVSQITIRDGDGELNLVKNAGGWLVKERGDYSADFADIHGLLRKLVDTKLHQIEGIGEAQSKRLNFGTNNGGSELHLKDASGKLIKELWFGKEQQSSGQSSSPFGEGSPVGRWVMDRKNPQEAGLCSETFSELRSKASDWLNSEFFKVEKLKAISVMYPTNSTNSWALTRELETAPWSLIEPKTGEQVDPNKANTIGSPFFSASFSDILVGKNAEDSGLAKPVAVTLRTFDDLTYQIHLGKKSETGDYPMQLTVQSNISEKRTPGKDEKPEDKEKLDKEHADRLKSSKDKLAKDKRFEGRVYLVSGWAADPILKQRADLLAEKKPDEPKPQPEKPALPPLLPDPSKKGK